VFNDLGEGGEFNGSVVSDEILLVRSELASDDIGSRVGDQALIISANLTTTRRTLVSMSQNLSRASCSLSPSMVK